MVGVMYGTLVTDKRCAAVNMTKLRNEANHRATKFLSIFKAVKKAQVLNGNQLIISLHGLGLALEIGLVRIITSKLGSSCPVALILTQNISKDFPSRS